MEDWIRVRHTFRAVLYKQRAIVEGAGISHL